MDESNLRRVTVARSSTKVETSARVLPAEEGEGRRKVEVTVRTTNDDGSETAFTVVVPIPPE